MRVTSFDSVTISIAWEPPPFSNRNGDIVQYHIRVTELETQTDSEYTSTTQNYTLTSLHPYYSYSISIAAETIAVGPYSTGLLQQTSESGEFPAFHILILSGMMLHPYNFCLVPSSAPGEFSVTAVNSTSLLLSWSEIPPPNRNGVIQNYLIILTDMTDSEEAEYHSNSSPFTVVGLHPDYTYLARVAAVTSVDAGPFSSSVQVRLPEDGKLATAVAISIT